MSRVKPLARRPFGPPLTFKEPVKRLAKKRQWRNIAIGASPSQDQSYFFHSGSPLNAVSMNSRWAFSAASSSGSGRGVGRAP